jgi:hypothetical protein
MTTLFKYETQGRPVTFLDEADQYDNETIRKHWQTSFPELGNCQAETKAAPKEGKLKEVTAEGQEVEVDKVVTFVKKVGTKGADDLVILSPEQAAEVRRLAAGKVSDAARMRLIEAAPRMLEELKAQRDLLRTLLSVLVFLHGSRQAVVEQLARLEAVIAEVAGETGAGSERTA